MDACVVLVERRELTKTKAKLVTADLKFKQCSNSEETKRGFSEALT